MILDVAGVELMPGNGGQDCPGNGRSCDERGNLIEPCCDECDYMMCCFFPHADASCEQCMDALCPWAVGGTRCYVE